MIHVMIQKLKEMGCSKSSYEYRFLSLTDFMISDALLINSPVSGLHIINSSSTPML